MKNVFHDPHRFLESSEECYSLLIIIWWNKCQMLKRQRSDLPQEERSEEVRNPLEQQRSDLYLQEPFKMPQPETREEAWSQIQTQVRFLYTMIVQSYLGHLTVKEAEFLADKMIFSHVGRFVRDRQTQAMSNQMPTPKEVSKASEKK